MTALDDAATDLRQRIAALRRELDERTAERDEALAREAAIAEVLQVINSSPGNLSPVFDAILEKALRLCEAAHGHIWRVEGQHAHAVALRGDARFVEAMRQSGPQDLVSDRPLGRLARGADVVHMPDATKEAVYRTNPGFREFIDTSEIRTGLVVALRKQKALLGAIAVHRKEVRPFTDKQIALLQNFAAQAVTAMENARLLTETREALDQQTATAEVLEVINSSPGDIAPVFKVMLEKASRLCDAPSGIFWTFDGEFSRAAALHGIPDAFAEYLREPIRLDPATGLGRVRQGEQVAVSVDLAAEEPYRAGNPQRRAFVDLGQARSAVRVPLIKDSRLLGIFTVYRQEVRPFTDKQVALLQNFAAQAVIAMENARLINETREALEQQTATSEVLQVINSSPGDLTPVFDAILEKAHSLCDIAQGSLELYDGEWFRAVAVRGLSDEFAEILRQGCPAADNPATQPLIEGRRFAHILDLAETDYTVTRSAAELDAARTLLCVPLRRDGALLGMIASARREVRPFSDKEIALLENFAAQAVIAMENARLIAETREALDQQTATAEVLQVINSSPGDLAPVFEAMLERAMRLCDASHAHLFTVDGEQVHPVAVRGDSRFREWLQQGPLPLVPGSSVDRMRRGERFVHVLDATEWSPTAPIRGSAS
jgi:GAF domain-containing protein